MSEEKIIHTFVVLAYKESPFLENAILSVLDQEYPSKVIIGTSTDNEYIRNLANKYHLDVVVNPIKNGNNIGDFDFAWSHGNNTIVTIAHQDDQYDRDYSKKIVEAYQKHPESIIIYTDYYEIRNEKRVYHNTLLNIKKVLLFPMRLLGSTKSKFWKQSALRWGNAICCPSVAFVPENIPFEKVFRQDEFIGVGDWYGWYKLSNVEGKAFTFIPEPLMGHRIEETTHTSREIKDGSRTRQELEMYKKFWPAWFAKVLNHFYSAAQNSNNLDNMAK